MSIVILVVIALLVAASIKVMKSKKIKQTIFFNRYYMLKLKKDGDKHFLTLKPFVNKHIIDYVEINGIHIATDKPSDEGFKAEINELNYNKILVVINNIKPAYESNPESKEMKDKVKELVEIGGYN